MLEKLLKNLSEYRKPYQSIDSTIFGDERAMHVSWTPVKRGGSSFRTHKLVQVQNNRIEFKATLWVYIFSLSFAFGGVAFAFFWVFKENSGNIFYTDFGSYMPIIISTLLIIVGLSMAIAYNKPRVFDKYTNSFTKGWVNKGKDYTRYNAKKNNAIGLYEIIALQIVPERVQSSKSSFLSYELNLMLKDYSRINVIDHGNLKKLEKDAERLADFLGVLVWNGCLITT